MATDLGRIVGVMLVFIGLYGAAYVPGVPFRVTVPAVIFGVAVFMFSRFMSYYEERGEHLLVLFSGAVVLPLLLAGYLIVVGGRVCEWFLQGYCLLG